MPAFHVACAGDGDYYAQSAVMLDSVAAHAGQDVHVHYLHGPRFPRRPLRRIGEMVEALGGRMTAHEMPRELVAGLPVPPGFAPALWYRIFLPELLGDVERVLYIDVDALATDDLRPLWETDMAGRPIAAVTNVLMPHHRHRPAELGVPEERYFNSGVLLMDLEVMRARRTTQALLACAEERGDALEWGDQDALSIVLGDVRVPLHPRWNAMNSLIFPWADEVYGADAAAEARRRPGIRHFEGPDVNKPWHRRSTVEGRDLWLQHRRRTPWPRGRRRF